MPVANSMVEGAGRAQESGGRCRPLRALLLSERCFSFQSKYRTVCELKKRQTRASQTRRINSAEEVAQGHPRPPRSVRHAAPRRPATTASLSPPDPAPASPPPHVLSTPLSHTGPSLPPHSPLSLNLDLKSALCSASASWHPTATPSRGPRPAPSVAAPRPRHDEPAAASGSGGGGGPWHWRRGPGQWWTR